jgi:2-dehydropantoate 2-reductase
MRSITTATFIKFGELDNRRSTRVERLRRAFGKTSVKADIPSYTHKALWKKFLLVTVFGGVGAVSRAPIDIMRTVPETRSLLEQCMEKVSAVARALGVQLNATVITHTMSYTDTLPANFTTSLQRDIAEGKPSEIDYWNGSVARQGRAVNVSTPGNECIYHSYCRKNCEREARWCFLNEPSRTIMLDDSDLTNIQ